MYSLRNASNNLTRAFSTDLCSELSFNPRTTMIVCFGLVQLFGICGNVLVVTSILRERRLQNNHYLLVMNLAICDLILLLCTINDVTVAPWLPIQKFSSDTVRCKIWYPFQGVLYIVEAYLLVFIAALRYRSVLQPEKITLARQKTRWLLLLMYMISSIWMIPCSLMLKMEYGARSKLSKDIRNHIIFVAIIICAFLVPTALLTFLYIKICRRLILHQRTMNELFSTGTSSNNRYESNIIVYQNLKRARNIRIVFTSIVITVVYTVSTLVNLIASTLFKEFEEIKYDDFRWIKLTYYIGVLSLNPVLYGFSDKSLRLGYKRSVKKILPFFRPR